MKFIQTFIVNAYIASFPINVKAEYIDMSGFEALQNRLSSPENINETKRPKRPSSSETSNQSDKKLEALNYCLFVLKEINKHYDTYDRVSTALMLSANSSFGIENIARDLESELDDYNHYARKIRIACDSSLPKISYVKQHFKLATDELNRYLAKYGY